MNPHDHLTLAPLEHQTLTILGYGSQGRAHANNLRDSGLDIRLGLRRGGASWDLAQADGWQPMTMEEATAGADLIAFLTPDLSQPALFERLRPTFRPGALLLFAHGFNVHYGYIQPPMGLDCALVAPKAPGAMVRRQFELGKGVPCLYALHADATGTARQRTLAYAHGLGGSRAGLLETTFAEETETDLFGEQAVLCGGATELVLAGFETLTDAGYQPEVAYFECLHELKLIVDLLYEGGLSRMHTFISETASYGDLSRGPRLIDDQARARMREILGEIQSGAFAREWVAEHANGREAYDALLKRDLDHPIEQIGRQLRSRMSWLPQDNAQRGAAK
jgi:ketol-acid reductoisomerase